MKRIILLVSVALLMTVGLGVANAQPAEQSPVGGTFAHPHHVHTPSGCVDIDSVFFEPAHRGLHGGSHASGSDKGPWHGACYQEHPHYPGQP
jgi:hypothetical protein